MIILATTYNKSSGFVCMYNMEICFGFPCKSHSFSSLSMVWLHLAGRKVGAQKEIGSKYVMPKALHAMPKATCPWSIHGLHVWKAMGAKPKALGAKMESIQVACQKHWVLKLVLSTQCTWRRCCGNLETPLVRKLLTFFHLPTHCSLWPWSLYDMAIHSGPAWSLSMAWSPIPLVVVPLVLVPLVWCLVMPPCSWWPGGGHGPQKRGPISMKDRWSATSGASGSAMGSVAPYPWWAPSGTAMLCP